MPYSMHIVLTIAKNRKLKMSICHYVLSSVLFDDSYVNSLDFLCQEIKLDSPSIVSGARKNYFHQLDAQTTYCLLGDLIFRVGCERWGLAAPQDES